MKETTIRKIEEIYDEALMKLKELEALQNKIIKDTLRKLEKEKIKQLQEQLENN